MPFTTTAHAHWTLSSIAGCLCPDSAESAGARFLEAVQDSVNAIDLDSTDVSDYSYELSDVADAAPHVYTSTRWAEFVDLGAYHENPTEFGDIRDMEAAAGICLYMIADRLALALLVERLEMLAEDGA